MLQSCNDLYYQDLDLFTEVSDYVSSTFDMWTNRQVQGQKPVSLILCVLIIRLGIIGLMNKLSFFVFSCSFSCPCLANYTFLLLP